jgi:hypothetical protein
MKKEYERCYPTIVIKMRHLNGILKQEYYIGTCFRNKNQAAVKQTVHLYGTRCPYKTLDYETPEKYRVVA